MEQSEIKISTSGYADVKDLSGPINSFLSKVGGEGLLTVSVPGATAGVTTIEYESGCIADLQEALEEIAPADAHYEHNKKWGDGNGFSHLRAALLGPGVTLPFKDGELQTGTWQQVVVVDCDNKSRERRILLSALSA